MKHHQYQKKLARAMAEYKEPSFSDNVGSLIETGGVLLKEGVRRGEELLEHGPAIDPQKSVGDNLRAIILYGLLASATGYGFYKAGLFEDLPAWGAVAVGIFFLAPSACFWDKLLRWKKSA